MRRALLAAAACLCMAPAYAEPGTQNQPAYIRPGFVTPLAPSCQLAVTTPAKALSACTGGIPNGAQYALICNEGTAARWRDDGIAPTASVGEPLGTGTAIAPICAGFSTTLSALQFIAESGTATLDISFYQ
jgi:hypothetical protein